MAFPRDHNESIPHAPSRRRRSRRNQAAVDARRQQPSRFGLERRRQRIAIGLGVALLLVIFGIVAAGYYQEFYRPPRITAAEIRNSRFSMGDLVERIRILQGINRYQGGRVDLSTQPFLILQEMINSEILRQAAPGLGISVSQEDIDEFIREQFYPETPAGQETDPGQLESEFRESYRSFLTATNLSESDYEVVVQESLMRQQLQAYIAAGVQDPQQQFEVEWIRLETGGELNPRDVRERLNTENFNDVALEVGQSAGFANNEGYVGWIPEGAFPSLDAALFGTEEQESLAVGEISDPISTQEGVYIIRKIAGPEEQELSDIMFAKLTNERLVQWQQEQQRRGSEEDWLYINFDSELYGWVADQVRVTAPRVTPNQPEQQPQQPQLPQQQPAVPLP